MANATDAPENAEQTTGRPETRTDPHTPSGGLPETQDEAPTPDGALTAEEGAVLMGPPEQLGGAPTLAAVEDGEEALSERFAADVANHEMTVLLDQGPHRHLHFAAPGPNAWLHWFEIVTWPGSIAIHGDMESFAANDGRKTFMHARTDDMFEFFRGKRINPAYWSQKVSGGAGVKEFSDEVFRDEVLEYAKDSVGDFPGLIGAVREQIFDESVCCAERAFALLDEFDHEDFYFYDFTERDFTKFSSHYLWCLHAIVWAIGQYDAAKPAEPDIFQVGRTYADDEYSWKFRVDAITTDPEIGDRTALGWRFCNGAWEPAAYPEDEWEIHQVAGLTDVTDNVAGVSA